MQENQVLRDLLKSLSSFIADGSGGILPKMGWEISDFNNFLNRSETDTAWESYQRHKRDASASAAATSGQKRPSDDDAMGSRSKRLRSTGGDGDTSESYPLLVPMNPNLPPVPANGLYPPTPSRSESGIFGELMRGPSGGSPMFTSSSPNNSTGQYSTATATSVSASGSSFQPSYGSPLNVNINSSMPSMPLVNTGNTSLQATRSQQTPVEESDRDPKRDEAYKLIQ